MWNIKKKVLTEGHLIWFAIEENSSSVSFENVLSLWQRNEEFRTFFIDLLATSPFTAYKWETPPITTANSRRPFEFVFLNSPGLVCNADGSAFSEHFSKASFQSIVEFENLGRDATLVVPCPVDSISFVTIHGFKNVSVKLQLGSRKKIKYHLNYLYF